MSRAAKLHLKVSAIELLLPCAAPAFERGRKETKQNLPLMAFGTRRVQAHHLLANLLP